MFSRPRFSGLIKFFGTNKLSTLLMLSSLSYISRFARTKEVRFHTICRFNLNTCEPIIDTEKIRMVTLKLSTSVIAVVASVKEFRKGREDTGDKLVDGSKHLSRFSLSCRRDTPRRTLNSLRRQPRTQFYIFRVNTKRNFSNLRLLQLDKKTLKTTI